MPVGAILALGWTDRASLFLELTPSGIDGVVRSAWSYEGDGSKSSQAAKKCNATSIWICVSHSVIISVPETGNVGC